MKYNWDRKGLKKRKPEAALAGLGCWVPSRALGLADGESVADRACHPDEDHGQKRKSKASEPVLAKLEPDSVTRFSSPRGFT